jgi:hypothetical protein
LFPVISHVLLIGTMADMQVADVRKLIDGLRWHRRRHSYSGRTGLARHRAQGIRRSPWPARFRRGWPRRGVAPSPVRGPAAEPAAPPAISAAGHAAGVYKRLPNGVLSRASASPASDPGR